MDRALAVASMKTYILSGAPDSLELALLNSGLELELLTAILFSMGYSNVTSSSKEDKIAFIASHEFEGQREIVCYDLHSHELTGKQASAVKKVYSLIRAIEGYLNTAVLLPPEMRSARIAAITEAIGVNEQEYKTVLKNWG